MEESRRLNREAQTLLAQANGSRPDYKLVTVAEMRARADAFAALVQPVDPPSTVDLELRLDGYTMNVRCYFPAAEASRGVLLYFHGGGWVMNELSAFDALCGAIADASGARVLSLAYPLAPETRYPLLLEQCEAAVTVIIANARSWSIDPALVAIGGDSAGGNIAAVLSHSLNQRLRCPLAAQLLIYPVLDRATDGEGFSRLGRGFLLDQDSMEWCWHQYLGDLSPADDPRVSPLRARSFVGLPPTLVISASHCPLTQQGSQYIAALNDSGVPAEQAIFNSIHSFVQFAGRWPVAEAAVRSAGEFLRRHLCNQRET